MSSYKHQPVLKASILFACLFILSGCATTTGPKVTSLEIKQAKERLEAKALRHKFSQLGRVANIGHKLIVNLPAEDIRKSYAYIGVKVAGINKVIVRAYELSQTKGVVIVAVIKDTPAEKAGLQVGDIILSIDDRKITNVDSFERATTTTKLKDKVTVAVTINRRSEVKSVVSEVDFMPRKIAFDMIDQQEVNAGAGSNIILATYGLMKFAESDDEIAVIMGHELAHITKGHISKSMGAEMLVGIAALGIGILSEQLSPGSGTDVIRAASGVGQVFGRRYSRDLEREADYFGLKYTKLAGYDYEVASGVWERFAVEIPKSMVQSFLCTHPASPERMVRLEKIIEELRTED